MTDILLFPVKESFRILVSFEFLYGINFYESFSAKAAITFPNEDNEVLINFASSSLTSTEFDFLTLSDPAKSISESVEDIYSVLDIF